MARVDLETKGHKALLQAAANVRAYAGSELSVHAVNLLDALMASYCLDLIQVQPEGLIRLQAALKQTMALRDVFANDGMDIPKI